jgi:hypothetical protein
LLLAFTCADCEWRASIKKMLDKVKAAYDEVTS